MKMDEAVFRDAKRLYDFLSDCPPPPARADFLLVLGSHDLRVPDHAAALFRAGVAPFVLCTGGYGKMTEGTFPKPEGMLFAERCVKQGVPESCILIEDKATNTGENFSFSKQLVQDRSVKTGIAVCKPYMAKRAWAAGTRQWPEVDWSVSAPALPFAEYAPDETALMQEIELMAGDLQRLRVYAEKGYQAPVDVPDSIWAVWNRLVDAGFDRYVLR